MKAWIKHASGMHHTEMHENILDLLLLDLVSFNQYMYSEKKMYIVKSLWSLS